MPHMSAGERALHFFGRPLVRFFYRVHTIGLEHLPDTRTRAWFLFGSIGFGAQFFPFKEENFSPNGPRKFRIASPSHLANPLRQKLPTLQLCAKNCLSSESSATAGDLR